MALTPYTINFVDDADKTALTIEPNDSNGPTSVTRSLDVELVGQGSTTWGEKINENIVHLLENFSSPEDSGNPGNPDPTGYLYGPITPTRGQLWFNSTDLEMYTYDGLVWKQLLTSAASGGSTTFTGTLETTLTSGDIFLADGGHVRETLHDGDGDWNFRHNSYYSAGDKYGAPGSGGASISFGSDGANGTFTIRTAVIGAAAGDPITWAKILQLTTTDLTLDGNTIWHAGNDGAGTGLDADLLDGLEASAFQISLTGAVTTVTTANLTADRVTVSNGAGKIAASTVTTTELDYLIGTTSSVQSQLTTLGTTINPPTISHLIKNGHATTGMIIDGVLHTSETTGGGHNAHTGGHGTYDTGTAFGILHNLHAVNIPSLSPVVDFGNSGVNAYALLANGELYTWGWNSRGVCGLGHFSQVGTPTLAAGGPGDPDGATVTDVYVHPSTLAYHVYDTRLIIKKSNGWLYGCGYNSFGQLGIPGNTAQQNTFQQLTNFGQNAKAVFNLGATYGCLVVQDSNDRILVAGYNSYGQLGIGSTSSTVSTPVDVTSNWGGGTGWELKQATGGFGYYTTGANTGGSLMMLVDDGVTTRVRTCGYNAWGQLGDTTRTLRSTPVIPFIDTGRVDKIAAFGGGPSTAQVLKENGDFWTWGHGNQGQTGEGTGLDQDTPTMLDTGVLDIYSDGFGAHTYCYHTTAFIKKADGDIYATGMNRHAECGAGFTIDDQLTFVRTLLPADADIVSIGHSNSVTTGNFYYALTTDGKVYVWGYDGYWGIAGAGTSRYARSPLRVNLPSNN